MSFTAKNRFCFFLIGVFIFLCASLSSGLSSGEVVFVDIRLMAFSHPLFKNFDPKTRRFIESASDPQLVRKEGFAGLKKNVEKVTKELENLSKTWGPKFKGSPNERKEVEKQFLEKRKNLENTLEFLNEQLFYVKELPGVPAFSEHRSILPQVRKISQDIKDAILELKKRVRAKIVLDVSSLFPYLQEEVDTRILFNQTIPNFWRENVVESKTGQVFTWLIEAKKFWLNSDDSIKTIPFGVVDYRLTAVEILSEILKNRK
ncbi:hypothetical protein HYY75_08825 [bacterium]|nr:hypothetical protein [bacterium]